MQDFRQLKVWQLAHQLTLEVYRVSRLYPKEELYGLTSQTRRCSSSIGANIAEGCGRGGDVDFSRFLQMAMGSASELEYHLLLARDLTILNEADHERLSSRATEIKRMLTALIQRLRTVSKPSG
jgi:four helix bundle protein